MQAVEKALAEVDADPPAPESKPSNPTVLALEEVCLCTTTFVHADHIVDECAITNKRRHQLAAAQKNLKQLKEKIERQRSAAPKAVRKNKTRQSTAKVKKLKAALQKQRAKLRRLDKKQ